MTDMVRNANHAATLLPSELSFYKRAWARRLWTLLEALLAKGSLHIWTATETGFSKYELDHVEMTYYFWHPFADDERHHPTRILAEYFEGQIELTRLEMSITAITQIAKHLQSSDDLVAHLVPRVRNLNNQIRSLLSIPRRNLHVPPQETAARATLPLPLTYSPSHACKRFAFLDILPKIVGSAVQYHRPKNQFCPE